MTRAILRVHPAIQVHRVTPIEDVYGEQTKRPRAVAAISGTLASIAIIAVGAGVFGLVSYSVRLRRREFGIRSAMGASGSSLRMLVVSEGLLVALVGSVAGSLAAWWIVRTTSALHYGVSPGDPFTWIAAVAIVGVTAILASWRPASEARRADPTILLRGE